MHKIIFPILLLLFGCKSNQTRECTNPLKGINQFEVALIFFPISGLNEESLFRSVVSSFEKIGNVIISDDNIYNTQTSLPVLFLSFGIGGDEKMGSISISADTEILINRCRIGSEIWKLNFNGRATSAEPEMIGDAVGFKKIQRFPENINLLLNPEKMIEQFAKAYKEINTEKPTFYIYSKKLI